LASYLLSNEILSVHGRNAGGRQLLRRKDDAEFGFSAHHACVSFGSLFEWELFDHGAHAHHLREDQRVLGVGGDAAQPLMPFLPKTN
jgi:hypothetical protein